jgi:alkaline phosphatase D
MSGRLRTGSATSRRRFLTTLASVTVTTGLGGMGFPAFSLASRRPVITHGVQSGDVSIDSAMVWARADRPARTKARGAIHGHRAKPEGGVCCH